MPVNPETWRFIGLTLSVWTLAANGSTFAFGMYSAEMKERFGMSQAGLNTVVLCGMIGGNFGLPSGWLFDRIGAKVIAFAAVLTNIGWLLLAMAYNDMWGVPKSVPAICAYYFMISWATCFSNTGGLLGSLQNFKKDAGAVVLIAESFVGLGATIYTSYYNAFFYPNVDRFFVFSACSNAVIFMLSAFLIPSESQLVTEDGIKVHNRRGSKCRFFVAMVGFGGIFLFNVGICVYQALVQCISQLTYHIFGGVTVALMVAFFFTPVVHESHLRDIQWPWDQRNEERQRLLTHLSIHANRSSTMGSPVDVLDVSVKRSVSFRSTASQGSCVMLDDPVSKRLQVCQSATLQQSLKSLNLWLLFYIVFAMVGTTAAIIFNVAQIYKALDYVNYNERTTVIYVAISGVGSAMGRIVVGTATEKVRYATTILAPVPFVMVGVLLIALLAPANFVLLPVFGLSGLVFGMTWSSLAVLSADIFGSLHLGKHYNFISMAPLFSALVVNIFIFSSIYDRWAHKEGSFPSCNVRGCVQGTFWILLGMSGAAALAAVALHVRCKEKLDAHEEESVKARFERFDLDADRVVSEVWTDKLSDLAGTSIRSM